MKLGLYGGSFDPIHNAHLTIAQFVLDKLNLDKILFIPAADPPHKSVFTPGHIRLAMVEEAIHDHPGFECSHIEIENDKICFSVDTIAALKERYGLRREDVYWIIGSDSYNEFEQWRSPETILSLCQLVVFPRPGIKTEPRPYPAIFLDDAPQFDVSSTMIRRMVTEGHSPRDLVPETTMAAIEEHELYTN